jgi:N6-adenosine-specific RNA methylase IME4
MIEPRKDEVLARRDVLSFTTSNIDDLYGYNFGTAMVDPPWEWVNRATRANVRKHYKTMTDNELKAMPVADLCAPDAHLHLWVPNALLDRGITLVRAWGFKYTTCFIWVKRQLGIGNYWRSSHEIMLLGVRGTATRFKDRGLYSWLLSDRTQHSEKPEEVRRLIPDHTLSCSVERPRLGGSCSAMRLNR